MHRHIPLVLVALLAIAAPSWAESQPAMSPDKPQYPYAETIAVELAFKGIDKDVEYWIVAVDAYDRVWLRERHHEGPGKRTITLRVPRMKGLALALLRAGKGDKEPPVVRTAACSVRIDARGSGSRRPDNFVNMIYGGDKSPRPAHRVMRSFGINGGMAYMWTMGDRFAADDMDYYHEYCSFNKRDIQNTDFGQQQRWFINDLDLRGCTIREDVLGHGEWKKRTLAGLDRKGEYPALLAKYQAEVVAMQAAAAEYRASKEPWTIKLKSKFSIGAFLHLRPQLARFQPMWIFQRPMNWFNPDETIFTSVQLQRTALADRANQAMGYSIGDEISNTHFTNPFDFDFSEITLDRFRTWLKQEYPSLAALNGQWGTAFAKWEDVIPYTNDETRIVNMPEYKARMQRMLSEDKKLFTIPWDKRTPPGQRNYSSWADWRSFQDTAWAEVLSDMARGMRVNDPGTPIGILGAQAPSAYGGYNYDKLFRSAMNWIEAYDIGCSKEIVRSFNKRLPAEQRWVISRTHFPGGDGGVYSTWYYLMMRDSSNVIWQLFNPAEGGFFEGEDTMKPTEKAITLRDTFLEVTDGIGKAFMESEEPAYPIAIYLSHSSVQAHWMIDSESDGATWVKRFGSWEGRNNSQNNNNFGWTKLLDDLGYRYDFVGKSHLLAGDLATRGYKVLILSKAIALGDDEAAAIRAFAEAGGTVIADTMTGTMDGHCRSRPGFTGALDGFFGIRRANYDLSEGYKEDVWPVPCFQYAPAAAGDLVFTDPADPLAKGYAPQANFYVPEAGITAAGATAHAQQGGNKAMFLKQQGKGRSVYMAASILRYFEDRLEVGKVAAMRSVVGNLLADVAGVPPFGRATEGGKPCNNLEFRPYSFGRDAWLYGIGVNARLIQDDLGAVKIAGLDNVEPRDVAFSLLHQGHLYDARRGIHLGEGRSATARLVPSEGLVVSVLPYKVEAVVVTTKPVETPDGGLRIDCEAKLATAGKPATAAHLIRFQLFNPKGVRVRYATVFATLTDGVARGSIHLSPNDLAGTWTVSARDIHTGLVSAEAKVDKKTASFRELTIPEDPFGKGALVPAMPESELAAKAGVFMSMRAPTVSVVKDRFQVKVQIAHLPESETTPEGTLEVWDRNDPSDKQTLRISDLLKGGNRSTEIAFSRPLEKAKDMDIEAVLAYEGVKRTDRRQVKIGIGAYGTPPMDAALADPVWQKASVLGGFRNFENAGETRFPTAVRVLFDDAYLYIGITCDLGSSDQLQAKSEVGRDGNWYAAALDTVEMLIGRTHAGEVKYNLAMSWNGAQSDKIVASEARYDGIPWQTAVSKSATGWAGVAKIPLAALGCGAPGHGDVWIINFNRYAFAGKDVETSQYAHQGREDFNFAKSGRLIMLGNPKPGIGRKEADRAIPATEVPLSAAVNTEVWGKAPELTFGYLTGLAVAPEDATVAKLAADRERLHFRVVASERAMDRLVAEAKTPSDGCLWEDDVIELYFDPDGKGGEDFRHLFINSAGIASGNLGQAKAGSWTPGLQLKVTKTAEAWVVEGSIPFADIGFAAGPGKTLRMNINRTKPGKQRSFWEETAWSPTFEGRSQVPGRFAAVTFR